MPKHRLYVDQHLAEDTRIELDDARAHYLARVLRLRSGDGVAVFCGDGREYLGTIETLAKQRAILSVGRVQQTQPKPPLFIRLLLGVSKGERMDYAVQKATELGVSEIVPLLTQFSVVRLSGERAERRTKHWRRVAESACEQSGRLRVPEISAPVRLTEWFSRPADAALRLAFVTNAKTNASTIDSVHQRIDVLIGPEGGLSPTEIDDATVAGFAKASLGPCVLRTETAAAVAVALVQARWGELKSYP